MASFGMAEQYGIDCQNVSQNALDHRKRKFCPFVMKKCNKRGGVCSITDGISISIVCPRRFREKNILFDSVSKYAFDSVSDCLAIGEVPFLDPVNDSQGSVGNIDNIISKVEIDEIVDWCGLEIQAAYFSGDAMGPEIEYYETHKALPVPGNRRPDIRSCATKRLLPQLEIKVPTLRRWGKKMFVAIDESFFGWMPKIDEVDHISNADICWVVFGLDRSKSPYQLQCNKVVLTTLEESRIGLIAGKPPAKPEYEKRIMQKLKDPSEILWKT